jgi:toxin-antitoxin system PIN domain toxin
MSAVLLDANVLIALLVEDHVHHAHAEAWFAASSAAFATCPVTQGSLMRLLIREGQSAESARSVLQEVMASPRHEFWSDNASYHDIPITGIIGHRQVTDAYLVHLARSYSARLATFDQALAKLHADVADLIPVGS